jgi:hypothetical protein
MAAEHLRAQLGSDNLALERLVDRDAETAGAMPGPMLL